MLSYVIVKRNYGESLVRGIKLSVEVRNDVYKRALLVLGSIPSFGISNPFLMTNFGHVFDQKSKTSLAQYHPLIPVGHF